MGTRVDVAGDLTGLLGELECLLDRDLKIAESVADHPPGVVITWEHFSGGVAEHASAARRGHGRAQDVGEELKYVLSDTLEQAEWHNSHLLVRDPEAAIAELELQPGRDLALFAGGRRRRLRPRTRAHPTASAQSLSKPSRERHTQARATST